MKFISHFYPTKSGPKIITINLYENLSISKYFHQFFFNNKRQNFKNLFMSSHRSVLKQRNKKHKSGHSDRNYYKTINSKSGAHPKDEKGSKERRNQSKEATRKNKEDIVNELKKLGTKKGVPKIVGFMEITENSNFNQFADNFVFKAEITNVLHQNYVIHCKTEDQSVINNFSHRIIPLVVARNNIHHIYDISKVADVLVLLVNIEDITNQTDKTPFLSKLSLLKTVGVPTILPVLYGERVDASATKDLKKDIQTNIFPDVDRVVPVSNGDTEQAKNFIRFLSSSSPKSLGWREDRPYMLIQNITESDEGYVFEGYLRGTPLNINQYITIPRVGDFKIIAANNTRPSDELYHPYIRIVGELGEGDYLDAPRSVPSEERKEPQKHYDEDPPPEREEEEDYGEPVPIQEDNDSESDDMNGIQLYPRTGDELEFSDEFDYPANEQLRDTLREYRSLESFVNSPWDPYENLPSYYKYIFEMKNFERLKKTAIDEQYKGEIQPNQFLRLLVTPSKAGIDTQFFTKEYYHTLFGLYRDECRYTVVNYTFRNVSEQAVDSYTNFYVIAGFRHLHVNICFSEYTRADKHLFKKTVKPDEYVIASFIAPLTFSSSPINYYLDPNDLPVATGSFHNLIGPTRLIIERKIITGSPYKALGKTARVCNMFFNLDDIAWFRTVPLRTKNKRIGHITGTVGSKGNFKAVFNGIVRQQDTVCMYLYKRVFPTWPEHIFGPAPEE